MNRQQEFEEQLQRNNQQVVDDLLNDQQWSILRDFYKNHFDEIEELLRIRRNSRMVIEDFYSLEPALKPFLNANSDGFLFAYQVNEAIKGGYLTQDMF